MWSVSKRRVVQTAFWLGNVRERVRGIPRLIWKDNVKTNRLVQDRNMLSAIGNIVMKCWVQ